MTGADSTEDSTGVSRRGVLAAVGAGAATVAGLAGAHALAPARAGVSGSGAPGSLAGHRVGPPSTKPDPATAAVPFHGEHQAGIVTPAQDRLYFAAFDVVSASRAELIRLLGAWTRAAEQLTTGRPVPGGPAGYDAPPPDTGEADGLPAARLTLTVGFGPSLFRDYAGTDRFGLADRQPTALRRLPHFPADQLDPRRSDGDLCVQACADDPQVAVHAVRNLTRIGFGTVSLRWSQLGFGRTSSTSTSQATPRNLFGFKDGTANLKAEDEAMLADQLWVQPGDDPRADWLAGGSYLVARRISMNIETWDRTSLREQEALIGRDRRDGAPLSGGSEFTEPDFGAAGRGGAPLIPMDSHVRLAHPSQNGGVRMLRRGYNIADGNDELGRLDAGLFFLCFVRDPGRQYIPMQTRLSRDDALMEYLQHRGSGLFAVPPGVRPGQYLGQPLFG